MQTERGSDLSMSYSLLLQLIDGRKSEVEALESFLRAETSWPSSPASTRFHLAKEGGLVEHSLNVANTLLKLREAIAPELSVESCVIAGLYHDVGKVGCPASHTTCLTQVSGMWRTAASST